MSQVRCHGGGLRINVVVAVDDPEWTAVAPPHKASMVDLTFHVFPPKHRVVLSFYAADGPQECADIYRMFHRAAFEPAGARAVLPAMDP